MFVIKANDPYNDDVIVDALGVHVGKRSRRVGAPLLLWVGLLSEAEHQALQQAAAQRDRELCIEYEHGKPYEIMQPPSVKEMEE